MLVASLAIVVFTVGFILGDFPVRKGADTQQSTITVTGQGETFAVPEPSPNKAAPTTSDYKPSANGTANSPPKCSQAAQFHSSTSQDKIIKPLQLLQWFYGNKFIELHRDTSSFS
jgi:hypothetical protein